MTSSILQDGGHAVTNLLPVVRLVMELVWEDEDLYAYQISMRYLNPRLRYYYFRFAIWSSYTLLWDAALYIPAKFRRHVTILAEVISIYLKSNMASGAILDL